MSNPAMNKGHVAIMGLHDKYGISVWTYSYGLVSSALGLGAPTVTVLIRINWADSLIVSY